MSNNESDHKDGQEGEKLQPSDSQGSAPNQEKPKEQETPGVALLPTSRQTDSLPLLLQKGVDQFKEKKDQDLFLIGAITVVSGLLTKVWGRYFDGTVYPNLYVAVIGGPATGKSGLLHAKRLTAKIHAHKKNESIGAKNEYQTLIRSARATGQIPRKPPFTVVNLSGNCSSSKFITHLADNQEGECPSILIESEIDTLNIVRKSEWGDFSDILRKAFQGEPISKSRSGDDEFVEVTNSKLAVAISGTPDQLRRFINNAEDGLYSRFFIHKLEGNSPWADPSPCDACPNLTEFFEEEQAAEYFEFWQFISQEPLEVCFSKPQWGTLNTKFAENYQEVTEYENPSSGALVKRHGLMLFKMCMALTALRKFEGKETCTKIECRQEDFDLALSLVEESLQHSLELVDLFPGGNGETVGAGNKIYDRLPSVFSYTQAMAVAKPLGITERTVERYLSRGVKMRTIDKTDRGMYKKHHVSAVSDDGCNI